MTIPPEYRSDHLFLLVGTNPLPNFVAAKLLLKENGTLYLVHSDETTKIAERLRDHLGLSAVRTKLLKTSPTDGTEIGQVITANVRSLNGTVGLHYTGGTKAMSVHAYRAMERTLQTRSPQPIFSYLDADKGELRIDPDLHQRVLLDVCPKLEELVALHGVRFLKGSPKRGNSLVLQQTAAALAESAAANGIDSWRQWCRESLRHSAHNGRGWNRKSDLVSIELSLPDAPVLSSAVAFLKQELGLPPEQNALPLDPDKPLNWPFGRKDPTYLCAWLDGEWLEQYVLSQFSRIAGEVGLQESAMNLRADRANSDFEFEFDVVALRGYQLFGISCTTDTSKDLAKSKLFEAWTRARQLGGDEARVGLVCGYRDVQRYANEIVQGWLSPQKVRVFGPQELSSLAISLANWVKTA